MAVPELSCLSCKTPIELQIMQLQYLEAILIASGGGPTGQDVNIQTINGIDASVGCGTADEGTLRVAQATDCDVLTIHALQEDRGNQVTTITASVAETTIATAVVGEFIDLYGLIITNTSATAVNVAIKDATAGTTRLNIAVPANDTRGFMLPASDGHKQAVVNNNWTATSSASVSSLVITALWKQHP